MGQKSLRLGFLAVLFASVESYTVPRTTSVDFLGPISIEAGGIHNIHISYNTPLDGDLSIHYGACAQSPSSASQTHHRVGTTGIGKRALSKRNLEWEDSLPERFVWVVPSSIPDQGCLHAFLNGDELIGVSRPIDVTTKRSRRGIPIADYVDAEGPWFDGVEYLTQKEPDKTFVAKAKGSTIGILGGGMSGLMSAVCIGALSVW